MLFGYPIFMLLPIALRSNTTPYSIIFRSFCVLLMIILLFPRTQKIRNNYQVFTSLLLLLCFWIILLVRIVYDFEFSIVRKQENLILNPTQVYLFAIFLSFLPIIIIFKNRHLININKLEKGLEIVLILSGLSVFAGVLIHFGFEFHKILFERTEFFYGSDYGVHPLNPISIGRIGSIIFLFYYNKLLLKQNVIYYKDITLNLLGLFLLLLSGSRGPLLSTVIFLIIISSLKLKFYSKRRLFLALALFLISFLVLFNIEELSIYKRIDKPHYGKDPTRAEIWSSAIQYFLMSPVFGYSIVDKFGIYPHNILIESLMAVGILGTIPFLIIIFRTFRKSVKIIKSVENTFFSSLFVIYFLFSMSSGSLYFSTEIWILVSIILFTNVKQKNEN